MSMRLKEKRPFFALALCAALFCSCGTKEDLFDSYNSCFVERPTGYANFTLTPETASLMLREVYEVSFAYPSGLTLSLSCPVECDSYDWYITRLENPAILSDTQNGVYRRYSRNFDFYITRSVNCIFYKEVKESEESCSYRIHLAVKVGNQNFYDSAVLVVRALTDEEKKEIGD